MTDISACWYRRYYGPHYLESVRESLSPARSTAEVDRILSQVQLVPPARVADVGCGDGRHACEFASRGFMVVAIDQNTDFIAAARRRCDSQRTLLMVADMREAVGGPFDLVVSLFHSFGFFDDADNARMLHSWGARLRTGGHFVLEVWNREMIERRFEPERRWTPSPHLTVHEHRALNQSSGRLAVHYTYEYSNGERHELDADFRLYGRDELTAVLSAAGLQVMSVHGSLFGDAWSTQSRSTVMIAQPVISMAELPSETRGP